VPSPDETAAVAPQEPDFGAVPAPDRELAERRYAAIAPLLSKAGRTAAEVRDRGLAIGISERTLWNWLRWYEQAADIRALLPRVGAHRRGRPSRSQELHDIIAERLEARWLKRPPWPLTDVAIEVIAEVERRNHERPSAEHIPLTRTAAGQVSRSAHAAASIRVMKRFWSPLPVAPASRSGVVA